MKANSTIGFLRRNLRHCPLPCRNNAYLALVSSKLEYGSVVWDPYLKCDIDRLERVQRSAARFITMGYKSREDGCVTKMLTDLGLSSLEERRRQQRLTLLYKVVKGHIPAINIQHNLEHNKNSFFVRITYHWNQLSDSAVSCDTVESFRTIISKRD